MDTLAQWLGERQIRVGSVALAQCVAYLDCVLEKSRTVNVTAVTDPTEALRLHLLDSLTAVPAIEAAPAGRMLDLGTGGGFPGVPCALATGRDTICLDSVSRKTRLVHDCIEESVAATGVQIEAICARSEELALTAPNSFSVVIVRAVAELPVLLELARPLLATGGHLVCLKGAPTHDESQRADVAADLLGFVSVSHDEFILPGGQEHRTILAYAADSDPRVEVPRRPGRAVKRPLA